MKVELIITVEYRKGLLIDHVTCTENCCIDLGTYGISVGCAIHFVNDFVGVDQQVCTHYLLVPPGTEQTLVDVVPYLGWELAEQWRSELLLCISRKIFKQVYIG